MNDVTKIGLSISNEQFFFSLLTLNFIWWKFVCIAKWNGIRSTYTYLKFTQALIHFNFFSLYRHTNTHTTEKVELNSICRYILKTEQSRANYYVTLDREKRKIPQAKAFKTMFRLSLECLPINFFALFHGIKFSCFFFAIIALAKNVLCDKKFKTAATTFNTQ